MAPVASSSGSRLAAATGLVERALGQAVELLAAGLVAGEAVILLAGVVSRYVLHNPLTWSDELATTLFAWLAMLGAAIATRADRHMRMTAFIGASGAPRRTTFDAIATVVPLAFCLLILRPAIDYGVEESFITTSALEISGAWRAAAMPVGFGLTAIFATTRLILARRARDALIALVLVAAITALFMAFGAGFKSLGYLNLIIFFVILVVAQVFGVAHLSMLSGFVFFSHQIGSFMGVWLGGYLYDRTGSYDIVWYISIALGVMAGLVNLPVRETAIRRPHAASPA